MEVIPSPPAPKRARNPRAQKSEATDEPKAAKAASSKTSSKKPSSRRKKAAPVLVSQPSPEEMGGMIAMAAYFIAEQRNFTPGRELEDWLEAEKQIKATYG